MHANETSTDTTWQMVDIPLSSAPSPEYSHNNGAPTKGPRQIQPFLGLRAKLSQAFASYAVVFFIISAIQLYRTRSSVTQFITDTKASVAQECYALERTLSTVATFPNLAAQGVNRGLVSAVESSISQVGYGLTVVLAGLVSTLELIMGLLTGTWRCFLVHLADSKIPLLSDVSAGGVQAIDQLNEAVLGLLAVPFNGLGELIESKMADPQIGQLVTIPALATSKVVFCDKALDLVVVNKLASDLKRWISHGTFALLMGALAVTLCNMAIIWYQHRRWMTHVGRVQQQLPEIAVESGRVTTTPIPRPGHHHDMKQDECMKEKRTEATDSNDDERMKLEALRVSHMVQHPLLYRFMDWSSKLLFPADENKRNTYLWVIHYVTHPPAVVCLLIGLLGLALTFGQIALIEHMRQNYRAILTPAIRDLSETIRDSVQGAMQSASETLVTETNTALSVVESDLNEAVFSEIVRAAVDLNSALVKVQTTLEEGVQTVFGESVLAKLVAAVLQCLLFNKLEAVERGLGWVQENARITLPRIADDMLMMDRSELDAMVAASVDSLMGPSPPPPTLKQLSSMPTDPSRMQMIEGSISKVFTQYEDVFRRELPVYYGLVAIWLVILLLGLTGARVILVRHSSK
ncbi:plasma membrane fusion protein prm1 [Mortierella sp. AD031]|nr:plasma membrane fusion protein prm1 [Mortierella sp. AD031]